MKINKKSLCAILLIYFLNFQIVTAGQPDIYTFTMKAIVVESASCSLNNGDDVAVFFGNEVDLAKIDGVNYKTPIAYNLHCKRLGKNAITMEINGLIADFGTGLLNVQPGLGIQILDGENIHHINKPFNIDGNNLPKLMAVPVKNSGAILTAGAFETIATIKVTYE